MSGYKKNPCQICLKDPCNKHQIKILSNKTLNHGLTGNIFFVVTHKIMRHLAINSVLDLINKEVIKPVWVYIQNKDPQVYILKPCEKS